MQQKQNKERKKSAKKQGMFRQLQKRTSGCVVDWSLPYYGSLVSIENHNFLGPRTSAMLGAAGTPRCQRSNGNAGHAKEVVIGSDALRSSVASCHLSISYASPSCRIGCLGR